MKTLDQFNTERRKFYATADNELGQPRPNGISCPTCKTELFDSSPMLTLTSSPPQKNIHCPKCGYTGYRIE